MMEIACSMGTGYNYRGGTKRQLLIEYIRVKGNCIQILKPEAQLEQQTRSRTSPPKKASSLIMNRRA